MFKIKSFASFALAAALGCGSLLAAEDTAPTWPFEAAKDDFSPQSLLDLRSLNEKVAGESGFITRSRDGNQFVLGNGKPFRIWAVGDGAWNKGPTGQPDLARHARWLAKRGINVVRVHVNLEPNAGNITDVNRTELDGLWRTVAAMKKEGIYTIFSPYWAAASHVTPAMGRLDSKGDSQGLLFFDKNLQDAYKAWMKVILTEKNPHTGIPLGEDPSLAIVELQNEDSLLFWTSGNIKGAARTELRKQFANFLTKKYGSLDKAKAAWENAAVPGNEDTPDDFANNQAAIHIVWQMTQNRTGGDGKRISDQVEFYTETMRSFNTTMGDYIHKDLACKALVNAGNWRTADNVRLLDAERYSYTANEVMAVNRYYSPFHGGKNNGWAIINGDKFQDESCLLAPRDFPVGLKQVEGYPIIITESSWVPPLGYQSEGPFLVAAYQSLTGVAGYFWFATGAEDWTHPGSANGFLPSEGKWVCATPMLAGQWPAASLMYRMGYVKKGEPAVVENRAVADIMERRMPIIAEDPGFDPNRDKGQIAEKSNIKDGVNPLAFLVGPVVAKYGADPAASKVIDLSKYIDDKAKIVKSNTDELTWDYGNGLCTLNSPKAQGVSGFLKKKGEFKLADIDLTSTNDYATILAVSMDDKPLATSAKILVQIGTTERPTGWKTHAAKEKVGNQTLTVQQVDNFGAKPWQIVKTDATLTLRNAALKTASVLDANGMETKQLPIESGKLKLPPDALYIILQ